MKRILQIKRKYFNDAPNYTEYYLHNAFQKFGYALTRDEAAADFEITAYINHRTDYMLFVSSFFDTIPEEILLAYTEEIAAAMKSDAMFLPHPGEINTRGVAVYRFLFSSTANAFEEPALIENGESVLESGTRSISVGGLGLKVTNFGGPSKGLEISIESSRAASRFLKIEAAQIRRYTKKGLITEPLTFEWLDGRYVCRLDDFEIFPGLNKNSALWCRSIKKYQ